MECDWLDNIQDKFEEVLGKLPEIVSPGITYICGVPYMGSDEFAVLAGSYYASKKNGKVLIFTLDYDLFTQHSQLDIEKINFENKNLIFFRSIDESYINYALDKYNNPEMLIFIYPITLQAEDPFEGHLCCEDIYRMIHQIYLKYKIPVLIVDFLESSSIILRKDHTPVLYDIPNWHLIQGFFHTIIFLHRDSYYNGRLEKVSTTFIVEKSPTIGKRKFTV